MNLDSSTGTLDIFADHYGENVTDASQPIPVGGMVIVNCNDGLQVRYL